MAIFQYHGNGPGSGPPDLNDQTRISLPKSSRDIVRFDLVRSPSRHPCAGVDGARVAELGRRFLGHFNSGGVMALWDRHRLGEITKWRKPRIFPESRTNQGGYLSFRHTGNRYYIPRTRLIHDGLSIFIEINNAHRADRMTVSTPTHFFCLSPRCFLSIGCTIISDISVHDML